MTVGKFEERAKIQLTSAQSWERYGDVSIDVMYLHFHLVGGSVVGQSPSVSKTLNHLKICRNYNINTRLTGYLKGI